jgi:penicillin-binding protein 2
MRGTWMRPHLVATDQPQVRLKTDLDSESVARVINGMYAVVNEGGTGSASRIPGVEFCGKTGTAQKASNEVLKTLKGEEWKDNAWFVGFAPKVEPEIVVAALFENGEHGDMAAPIVRDVVKAYFDKKAAKARQSQPQNLALRLPSPVPLAKPLETAKPSEGTIR